MAGYARMHAQLHKAVDKRIEDLRTRDLAGARDLLARLHFNSEYEVPVANASGARDICLHLSCLLRRFKKEGLTAGIVFIDTFDTSQRFLPSPTWSFMRHVYIHARLVS